MVNELDLIYDRLIIPLQKRYKIEFYYPKIETGLIEYKFNCVVNGDSILGLELHLFYGEFCKDTTEADGKYNFLVHITYLGGESNEGGKETNIGIINLDNENNCIKSIDSIINGLKDLDFIPDLNDVSNIEYGKVLIHGYKEWYAVKPDVKVYQNNNLIGTIKRNGTWIHKFDENTDLTLKINSYKKTNVKIKANVNNEVFLNYGGYLIAKVKYLTSDIDFDKINNLEENDKFINWSKWQYRQVILRRFIYIVLFILSIIKFKGMLSTIFFWTSLIALIINVIKFQTNWKHISGPKYLNMDQVYESQIRLKLIPKLNYILRDYQANILDNPISKGPSHQTYNGNIKDGGTISLTFYNRHEEMKNREKFKYPMLVKYNYKDKTDELIGEIDLSNNKNIQESINIIINTLEKADVINKVM